MASDQEAHNVTLFRTQIEPGQHWFGNFQAGSDVVLRRSAFAQVVQQQGKVQQLRLLQFTEDVAVTLVPLGL